MTGNVSATINNANIYIELKPDIDSEGKPALTVINSNIGWITSDFHVSVSGGLSGWLLDTAAQIFKSKLSNSLKKEVNDELPKLL